MANRSIQLYQEGKTNVDRELEERRCRLLVQLNGYDEGPGLTNASLTEDLRKRYNEVVDEQWDHRRGSFCDPLVALPPDVWSSILKMVTEDNPYALLLTLPLVSQAWADKLISCPTLWTKIIIDSAEEDLLAKMAIFLHLSRQSNLKIELVRLVDESFQREVHQLLAPHKDRITGLSNVPPHDWILRALQWLGPLPRLQGITMIGSQRTDHSPLYFRHAPNLRQLDGEISGRFVETVLDSCLFWPYSTSLKLHFPGVTKFCGRIITQFTFNYLRHLQLDGHYLVYYDFLTHLHSPLTSLAIKGCPRNVFKLLIEAVARFTHLETLDVSLRLQDVEHPQKVRINEPPSILSVKSFKLMTNHIKIGPVDSIDEGILDIMGTSIPYVECLTLCYLDVDAKTSPRLLSIIKSLSRLQELHVMHAYGSYPAEVSSIDLPSLSRLEWWCNSNPRCPFHLFWVPNLTSYTFTLHSLMGHTEASVISQADFLPRGCGNSLTKLGLYSHHPISLSLRDLPALRELELSGDTHSYWSSDVLEQLILTAQGVS